MLDQDTLEARVESRGARRVDAVADAARQQLRASTCPSVRNVRCEHHEGVLVLRGRVSSYYHKQMAQEAVRRLRGVEEICNVVEVVLPVS